MMKSGIPRRDFLKLSIGAGLSPLLSSCTALDQLFLRQTGDNTDRIVILGGGMAGLRAAYELRKNSVPSTLFEGSDRIGGRAWSLQSMNPAAQIGELGCEWFSNDQKVFWDLAKELKLEIVEVRNQRDRLFIDRENGPSTVLARDLAQIREVARRSEGLSSDRATLLKNQDRWNDRHQSGKRRSAIEWAGEYSKDSFWVEMVQSWSILNFGVPAEQIHSRAFAKSFLFQDQVLDCWAANRYRFRGGSSSLAAALADRIMGAIPGDRLRMGYRLRQVEKLETGFDLHFETPEGRRRLRALHVICALPWALLPLIEGIENLLGPEMQRDLPFSHQSKAVMSFSERFWRKKWDQGRVLGKNPYWESSYRVQELLENSWGLITRVWSGAEAQKMGPAMIEETLQMLSQSEKKSLPFVDSQMKNWSESKWAKARGSFPSIDEKEKFFQNPQGTWTWAGEHASDEVGTWAGALQSGAKAARLFTDAASLKIGS